MDQAILQKWLKSGYMEKHVLHETTDGTPQGGNISPALSNCALDGLERVRNLDGQRQNQFGFHRSACNAVLQRQPVQKLHGYEGLSILLPDLIDSANVGMIQCRGGLRLPLEAGQRLGGLWLLHRAETSARRIGVELRPRPYRPHPCRRRPASRRCGSARWSGRSLKRIPNFPVASSYGGGIRESTTGSCGTVPSDSETHIAPCPSYFVDPAEQSSSINSRCGHPIVQLASHPIGNRNRSNLASLADQINNCPMLFALLEMIQFQGHSFMPPQPTRE